MKAIHSSLILILLLSISGCRKHDDDDSKGPFLIPEEVKAYSLFQPGTYWVYIDSISGRVDSIYVYDTDHTYDTLEIGSSPKRVYEIYVVKTRSAMDGYDYFFEVNTTYSYNDETLFDLFEEKMKPGDYVGKIILFLYKPYIGQDLSFFGSHIIVRDIIKSYIQNGETYSDVVQVYHDKGIEVSNNVTNFIAKNYGIIRKEYADSNQVWKLTRSLIIQ